MSSDLFLTQPQLPKDRSRGITGHTDYRATRVTWTGRESSLPPTAYDSEPKGRDQQIHLLPRSRLRVRGGGARGRGGAARAAAAHPWIRVGVCWPPPASAYRAPLTVTAHEPAFPRSGRVWYSPCTILLRSSSTANEPRRRNPGVGAGRSRVTGNTSVTVGGIGRGARSSSTNPGRSSAIASRRKRTAMVQLGNRRSMRSGVFSMMILVVSHNHVLRLTMRQRVRSTGQRRTEYRVFRVNRTCRRCLALSVRLTRSARQFRASISKFLVAAR